MRAAQASRGAAFEGAGLVRRLRAYGGLMVPVLVGALSAGPIAWHRSYGGALLRGLGRADVACRAPFRRRRRGGPPRRRCRLR